MGIPNIFNRALRGGGVEGGMDIAGESRTDNEVVDAGGGIWGGIP